MGFLVACKNEEDPIKNEGARVVTTLFIDFSDAQGELTPKSVKESCRYSNSSELLWLVLLPAKIMKKSNKQCLLDTPRTVRVSEKTWQVIVQTSRP